MGNRLGPFIKYVSADRNLKFWSLQLGGCSADCSVAAARRVDSPSKPLVDVALLPEQAAGAAGVPESSAGAGPS